MLFKSFRSDVFVKAALLIAVSVCAVKADTVVASLYSPIAVGGATPIAVNGVGIAPIPSQTDFIGSGYTIDFSGVSSVQGIVQGDITSPVTHAVPVAGVDAGNPEYLTGDYGSPLTTSVASSGNYLSTGLGTITIHFATTQKALALLWGSIDTANQVTLNDVAGGTTVTGTEVQAAAAGFTSNGFQGPGGSAYVTISSDTGFDTATFTSGVVSFEFAGVVGSSDDFDTPEPSSMLLIGTGLGLGFFAIRRRRNAN